MNLIVSLGLLLAGAFVASADSAVVAELFTSGGCSSCPPADVLLERLDRTQPVSGAHVIVLSEHVDYWDNLGWRDPFSSHEFSERQANYARRFHLDGPYTPQLVIDGRDEVVGSNGYGATAVITKASGTQKARVRIESAKRDASGAAISIETHGVSKGNVWVAIAGDHYTSSVRRGENSGRTLTHVAVVHVLKDLGSAGGVKTVHVPVRPEWTTPLRVVAFVQESGQGPILGASTTLVE
jgi:hypothetical protein